MQVGNETPHLTYPKVLLNMDEPRQLTVWKRGGPTLGFENGKARTSASGPGTAYPIESEGFLISGSF